MFMAVLDGQKNVASHVLSTVRWQLMFKLNYESGMQSKAECNNAPAKSYCRA
jgi:hypothetical protein